MPKRATFGGTAEGAVPHLTFEDARRRSRPASELQSKRILKLLAENLSGREGELDAGDGRQEYRNARGFDIFPAYPFRGALRGCAPGNELA